MAADKYSGLLAIGDPHLASRTPGFRKDEYSQAILQKLRWCLDYAIENQLLPMILGDLFHMPRDNANWLLGEVIYLLARQEVIGIHGNHDCREDSLGDNDSLSVLVKANALRLVSRHEPWTGIISGRSVTVGGTSWGGWLPKTFEPAGARPLVFWLTHHDVQVPGYEDQGRFRPKSLQGIDCVINGHIHRHLESVQSGDTWWLTPGNISRVSRSDITRSHTPSVLQINIDAAGWRPKHVEVPHEPFDDVFLEEIADEEIDTSQSAFVRGLAQLQAQRTDTGAGLREFLAVNLDQFEQPVADEIRKLAEEVLTDESESEQ